ncbi:hypothetical protein IAE19_06455 [Acinetobacter sp. S40]|uniref:hypothetical protein n=1 Tax=unclassified Acinetobacter TaxID=196816 RepID=UPI00190E0FD5|nr:MULTISPECIES: hypothetical protein [unclassified Acinetobacter]MBJ9985084.1 hypothetical protein [Acinetobacter sp. S40]MBK0062924.1 hypothetical protein [Acinetobacter sp. S55]MBK0066658.1 hypothetical protein [Acinetobacter sp. S54]
MRKANETNLDYLNNIIDDFKNIKEKPSKILIGYKIYAELMNDTQFKSEILESALDPNKRKYRKLKIKITQDDYQLKIE